MEKSGDLIIQILTEGNMLTSYLLVLFPFLCDVTEYEQSGY